MSVDQFFVSPEHKMAVMVGSLGSGGVKAWPHVPEVQKFIYYAIDNFWTDVSMMDEGRFDVLQGEDDWCENFEAAVGIRVVTIGNIVPR